jgi:uncharacterized protein YkwD
MKIIKFLLLTVLFITSSIENLEAFAYRKHSQNSSQSQIEAQEIKIIELINQERAKKGLKPLSHFSTLTHHARQHSYSMACGEVDFGHAGFDKRAQAIIKMGQHKGFGENVAYCHHVEDPLTLSVANWMKSKGHRENILGDYDETGVGISYDEEGRFYVTQLFAKRKS